ncbi:DUF6694 family lipoprotein [Isoalcanivorax beigongshangi]|uniref:DUF6694 family lipoprotein n=1 Tax=Isoalcanivorax beigongshangi TaxID=3238810 RepID=A0ABV4AIB8_9GAMM
MKKTMLALLATLMLAACGASEPTLDTSSDAALDRSVQAVQAGLNESEQEAFAEAFTLIMLAGLSQSLQGMMEDGNAEADLDVYMQRTLDGLTGKEVIELGGKLRQQMRAD